MRFSVLFIALLISIPSFASDVPPMPNSTEQPTLRFIESNGIRMRIAEMGKGPLVILVHGWPESWYSWRHQLVALAGAIVDLGDELLTRLRTKTVALLPPEQVESVAFSYAEGSNLSALGAVALAIHNELDIL